MTITNQTIVPRSAEDVLAGHPDRICDAIAEALVERACWWDKTALVGVEVALHRHVVYITGRIAASYSDNLWTDEPVDLSQQVLQRLVADAFASAGYEGCWRHDVNVVCDLDVGPLLEDERSIRRFSDDQGIATGYADPSTRDRLPLEHSLARAVRTGLAAASSDHSDLLGPDGKVLVRLGPGVRPRLSMVNVAIQHVPGVGFDDLYQTLVPHIAAALDPFAGDVELPSTLTQDVLRCNGIGDFTCGGPMGDNGLSGKKLVVDHYGPQVPIGGGAICGKDPHKPDRVGPLRARQLAVRLAEATAQRALVHIGWLPGLEAPDRCWATLEDGTVLNEDELGSVIQVPDLTLAGSAIDLELAAKPWQAVQRAGYFGNGQDWER